jgi:hypothetical protein
VRDGAEEHCGGSFGMGNAESIHEIACRGSGDRLKSREEREPGVHLSRYPPKYGITRVLH